MATLREYFDADFGQAARLYAHLPFDGDKLEAVVLYDFTGYYAFLAIYVPGVNRSFDYFNNLAGSLKYSTTKLEFAGRVSLPAARLFPGRLQIQSKPDLEVLANFHGDPDWISTKGIQSSRRVFIYAETTLSNGQVSQLKESARAYGHELQFRSPEHAASRAKFENPLAFISHDSRDKDVARKIALNLQRMLVPVWYDEFTLRVGDRLRESIEKGLKECRKCVLVLSKNFLTNNGWTKVEFNSIFTREIIEERHLVLPVWLNVEKEEVYEYSPSLINVLGVDWNAVGEEEACRRLAQATQGSFPE